MMTLQEVIVESHDDFPIWSSVVVGFDDDKSLVVLLEHDDYDEPDYAYKVYATVDKRDAMGMARRLNVSLTDLPGCKRPFTIYLLSSNDSGRRNRG